MVRSMTGFGRDSSEKEGKGRFSVEIKSINHRYLDINIRMPRSIFSLEEKIRKLVSEKLTRGKVDIFINYINNEGVQSSPNFNKDLGDSYLRCLEEIRDRYNIRDDISVSLVARFPEVIFLEEKDENLEDIWMSLQGTINNAITMLLDMRCREGEKLKEDIVKKCNNIKFDLDKIEKVAPEIVISYKNKLNDRIKELLGSTVAIDEARLSMEVAVFADKCSIDEEITRLNSHIIQVIKTLESDESIGRKLDFLVQEMNREANTIASKANNLDITNLAINIKNEIEKIREQIQNIE